jgi:hypothetical protein
MRNCVIAYLENIFIKNRIKLDTILGMKSSGHRRSGGGRRVTSLVNVTLSKNKIK